MKWLLLQYGIHQPAPIKFAWIGLTYLSVALKMTLIGRLWHRRGYEFPGLIVYMAACCVSGAFQNTKAWGFWGELLLTIGSALYVLETVQGTCGTVQYASEVRYIRLSTISLAGMMIGVGMMAGPPPFEGYPKLLYYLHLYAVVACFSALAYSLGFHFYRDTKIVRPFWANSFIGMIWFGVPIMTTQLNTGKVYTNETYPWGWVMAAIGVQIACLIAWLFVMTDSPKREVYELLMPRFRV